MRGTRMRVHVRDGACGLTCCTLSHAVSHLPLPVPSHMCTFSCLARFCTCLVSCCGIVYHGNFHFIARLIDKAMNTYYYDEMKTGPECIPEGKFDMIGN